MVLEIAAALAKYYDCGHGSSMDSFGKVILELFGSHNSMILTRIVSGVFADLYQDPDLHFHQ